MALRVFISWSGELSHQVALALRDWLPVVIPGTETWVSSENIPKGSRWGSKLAQELESTNCGIICVLPENETEPWLYFEAGALSKSVDEGRVHPFLLTGGVDQLHGSLAQFQATKFDEDDIWKLVQSLNDNAGDDQRDWELLKARFKVCWTNLEHQLRPLADKAANQRAAAVAGESVSPQLAEPDDELLKTLCFLRDANGKAVNANDLATNLQIRPDRARFLYERLTKLKLAVDLHNAITGTSWKLSSKGREELDARGLL